MKREILEIDGREKDWLDRRIASHIKNEYETLSLNLIAKKNGSEENEMIWNYFLIHRDEILSKPSLPEFPCNGSEEETLKQLCREGWIERLLDTDKIKTEDDKEVYLARFHKEFAVIKEANLFGYFLIVGITILLFVHMLVNIGMNIGLMPVTGIPLPFISYGGSALLSMSFAIGLVLSVYRLQKSIREEHVRDSYWFFCRLA